VLKFLVGRYILHQACTVFCCQAPPNFGSGSGFRVRRASSGERSREQCHDFSLPIGGGEGWGGARQLPKGDSPTRDRDRRLLRGRGRGGGGGEGGVGHELPMLGRRPLAGGLLRTRCGTAAVPRPGQARLARLDSSNVIRCALAIHKDVAVPDTRLGRACGSSISG
jgi:hypothetical protein